MLPTGRPQDEIDGVPVTLIDVAMPMMVVRADSLGTTGYETPAELFMLTILGLSMVGVLAGKSMVKGLSACGLGIFALPEIIDLLRQNRAISQTATLGKGLGRRHQGHDPPPVAVPALLRHRVHDRRPARARRQRRRLDLLRPRGPDHARQVAVRQGRDPRAAAGRGRAAVAHRLTGKGASNK